MKMRLITRTGTGPLEEKGKTQLNQSLEIHVNVLTKLWYNGALPGPTVMALLTAVFRASDVCTNHNLMGCKSRIPSVSRAMKLGPGQLACPQLLVSKFFNIYTFSFSGSTSPIWLGKQDI